MDSFLAKVFLILTCRKMPLAYVTKEKFIPESQKTSLLSKWNGIE